MKRLLALFLAVIMTITLLPASVFAAGGKLVIADAVGTNVAKEVSMDASMSGNGWTWDSGKKTLTLNGFNGEYIEAGGDIKIVLKGKNTITLPKKHEYGIKVNGKLTIDKYSSSTNDTLTITQKNSASSSNLIETGGVGDTKSCVINGGTITLTNTTGGGNGSGVRYQTDVNNDASLIISVPYRGVGAKLNANTSGKIDITTTGNNAFAAAAFGLNATGKGTVNLKAKTPAVTVFDSLNIGANSGNVVLDGYTKVSSDPLNNFTVAYNKKLENSDSYYQGWYTTDPTGNPGFYLIDSQGNPLSKATYTTVNSQKLTVMDTTKLDLEDLRVGVTVNTNTGVKNATRGGEGNYRFSLKSGSTLPDGLKLNELTGAVTGIPTKPCESKTFVVVVKDKKGVAGCNTAEVTVKYGSVKASDEYLTVSGQKYNMKDNLASSDYTWKFTAATKTMELHNYTGGPIRADSDLNIVLQDSNNITVQATDEYGIYASGKLTIDKTNSSVSDILTIRQVATATSADLIVTGGTGEAKACVINGGMVNLACATAAKYSVGIKNSVYVNNDGILNIDASYRGVGEKLVADTDGEVAIMSTGQVEGAAAVYSLEALGGGLVTLAASGQASTVYNGLKVAPTAGKVILNGYTMVKEKPYQNFSLANNKQVFDIDNHPMNEYYLGCYTLGIAGQGYYLSDSGKNLLPSAVISTQSDSQLVVMDSPLFNLGEMMVGAKVESDAYILNGTRGGNGTYVFSVKSGYSLPKGLTLNSVTGGISGIPTEPCQPGAVTIVVKDNDGNLGCSKEEIVITYGEVLPCELGVPKISATNKADTGKVQIKWTALPGAQKYEVYRSTALDGTYKKLGSTTGVSYTNTSSETGKTYYYKVRAIGYDGDIGTFSTVVSRCCDCPRPTVTLSNVASSGKIKLSWAKVEGASKYEVYRSTALDGTYTKLGSTTGTSYTNTSAKAGTKYYYKIKAICAKTTSGNSAYSEIVGRVCDCARPVVKITNVASSGKIKLSWAAVEGASKYDVYRATSSGGTYTKLGSTTGLSYTNTSAVAGKKYYYKVKAVSSKTSDATSAYSTAVYRVCDCAKPVVKIALSSNKPKLSWAEVDGADKYEIYRATSKNGTYSKLGTTTNLSYKNTGASKGKSYFYKVRAISNKTSSATSAYSSIVSITSK